MNEHSEITSGITRCRVPTRPGKPGKMRVHHYKNSENIPGNLLKNLEKSWKSHGILSVRKSGNPEDVKRGNMHEREKSKLRFSPGNQRQTVENDCIRLVF